MNAKKITSLVLAAVMAAGTSTVAFAAADKDTQLEIIPGSPIYTEDDGVLVVDTDGVAPGDTIYIRLDEYEGADASTKDKKRFNVYADWKVGEDSVEDMDIVYKKGEFRSNSNYSVEGYTYTISAPGSSLDGKPIYIPGDKLAASDLADLRKALENSTVLADAILADYDRYDNGYSVTGKGFAADEDAAAKMAGYTSASLYRMPGTEKAYADGQLVDYLTDNGFIRCDELPTLYIESSYGADKVVEGKTTAEAGYTEVTSKALFYAKKVSSGSYVVVYVDAAGADAISDLANTELAAEYTANGYQLKGAYYFTADEVVEKDSNIKKLSIEEPVYEDASGNFYTEEDVVAATLAKVDGYTGNPVETRGNDDGYTYWIKIDTKEDKTTKLLDLAGTLTIGTSRSKAEDGKVYNLDTTMSNRTDPYNVVDEITIEANSNGAVKFDEDAEDVVIYFGDNEAAWYEFDARGQSALNFEWNMDFNREIADLFPNANIDFISWVAEPSTNRTGTLYITADADSYIYEVTEDGVKEVANAKYNEDEEAWEIRTRKLTAYAISDRELDTSVTLDGEDNTSSSNTSNNGGKDNPDTGR